MENTIANGWGFESANGMLWPESYEERSEAIASIEKEVGTPWERVEREFGVKLVKVEISKP